MAKPVPSFLVAAARKSSGKTTLSLGLARAFSNHGLNVQTFKKGPDYIDPLWLKQASGNRCFNLDFNSQSEAEITHTFRGQIVDADIAIIESNKGLFDGLDLHGSDSNGHLAKILNTPVVLVIDTIGMTRGIAPLLQGYVGFDSRINIAGVILNKTGSTRHEEKLRNAVQHYTNIPVLGAFRRDDSLVVNERHLGLTTPGEKSDVDPLLERLAASVAEAIDLEKILEIANISPTSPVSPIERTRTYDPLSIAIPRDEAFGFYYEDDLQAFENAGAKLHFFSALKDKKLPPADGLFIGGGFPETHMKKLEENKALRHEIKMAIENGLPTYAECGGLMYLARSIEWRGNTRQMVGVIAGECHMHGQPQGRGFARLKPTHSHPWGAVETMHVHEFHYSDITGLCDDTRYAYDIKRGHGINGKNDGIVIHNLLANFCHFRNTSRTPWVGSFLNFVRNHTIASAV